LLTDVSLDLAATVALVQAPASRSTLTVRRWQPVPRPRRCHARCPQRQPVALDSSERAALAASSVAKRQVDSADGAPLAGEPRRTEGPF
jgi:hypothetical protein